MAKKKSSKEEEKLFTPGNIILGLIIIALIGSLFFDFFGSVEEVSIGCPQPIPNLIITNIVLTVDDEIITPERTTLGEYDSNADVKLSGLLRNVGKDEIVIRQTHLTEGHLGEGELIDFEEPIVVKENSMKIFDVSIPSANYHKIDFYTIPCEGNVIWHDLIGHDDVESTAEEEIVEEEFAVEGSTEEEEEVETVDEIESYSENTTT